MKTIHSFSTLGGFFLLLLSSRFGFCLVLGILNNNTVYEKTEALIIKQLWRLVVHLRLSYCEFRSLVQTAGIVMLWHVFQSPHLSWKNIHPLLTLRYFSSLLVRLYCLQRLWYTVNQTETTNPADTTPMDKLQCTQCNSAWSHRQTDDVSIADWKCLWWFTASIRQDTSFLECTLEQHPSRTNKGQIL